MYNPQNLAHNIKRFRKMRSLTQSQLAEMIYVTPQNISKWEVGISAPDIEKLCEIAGIFDVSVDVLLGITENHPKKAMLAIDGGGTKTEFLIFDRQGEVFENFVLPGSNPNSVGMDTTYAVLKKGIDSMLEKNICVSEVYAGISGIASGDNKKELLKLLKSTYRGINFEIETDIINTFYSIGECEHCIAAICGTGSVVYSKAGDSLKRFGGWGYLFEESGSGYSIGRDVLREALAQNDGIKEKTVLYSFVKERLNGNIWNNIDKIYSSGKDFIASFSKTAYDAYKSGDAQAKNIFIKNARGLAFFINEAAKNFPRGCNVILSGSVIQNNDFFCKTLRTQLNSELNTITPDVPPIIGAAAYCCKRFGKMNDSFWEQLKKNYINFQENNNA